MNEQSNPVETGIAESHGDDPYWYKDAIIYQLHIKAFFDSSGDGFGDFRGLTSKLDYIESLGVNTIWALPFYPSPMRDDGYDVSDYRNIHPQYGTRADFRQFVREAHRRGLRVITELIINHTSDQHPWFQAARRAPPDSPKRNYYVWSDTDQRYSGTRIIFTDTEPSNWTWDPVAKAYFWHRFFSHQPDLNFDNPNVLKAVFRIMRFWLDMGVDGFRLDAIPYLIERDGTSNENLPETHAVIRELRSLLDAHYTGKLLLAEANQWPEDVREYLGDGDECHMAYHFPLMPRMYMAIAQEDAHPIVEIMQQTPDIPESCQWAIFLRNHDELTLEMVTSRERDYMYQMYAADPRARLNLGIRRRLAPLMENDVGRIKLMNSLLLSMPGSPIIYYGDELGMGDNVFLGDRDGVRTPMQWSPDRNAGFSRADPQQLYLPPIMDPVYGYEAVNVESQERDPSSLLQWVRRMLAVRKSSRTFGRGKLTFLKSGNRKILAYLRECGDEAVLCVANVGRSAQPVELQLGRFRGRVPVEMLGRTPFPPIGDLPYLLTLPAHGFYWFRLATDVEAPRWHEAHLAPDELPVVVLFDGWSSFFRDRVVPWRIGMAEKASEMLETRLLPHFIEKQRWYAAKGQPIARAALVDHAQWQVGDREWLVTFARTEGLAAEEAATYLMPLALAWEDKDEDRLRALAPCTLAKVRQQASVGVLAEAFGDEAFNRAIVSAIAEGLVVPMRHGQIHFTPTSAFAALAGADFAELAVSRPRAQSSNTIVLLGERLFLKAYRRLREGENLELEIGRFLTETAHFAHCVPVAGAIQYRGEDGTVMTLGMLQAFVANQGDGWTYTVEYVERFLEACRATVEPVPDDAHGGYLALVQTLGQRTAELHCAFASDTTDPAFSPAAVTAEDLKAWQARTHDEALATFDLLATHLERLPEPARSEADALLARAQDALTLIEACAVEAGSQRKIRIHGDYHLGQVLLAQNDFVIIDFEGEPARPLEARRAKTSPLRDVAGMLRSFSYARWASLRATADGAAEFERLAPSAAAWEAQTRQAFLSAYETCAVALYGSAPPRELLTLFELEKAFYELRYELNNRPDWVRVPLAGVIALLAPMRPQSVQEI